MRYTFYTVPVCLVAVTFGFCCLYLRTVTVAHLRSRGHRLPDYWFSYAFATRLRVPVTHRHCALRLVLVAVTFWFRSLVTVCGSFFFCLICVCCFAACTFGLRLLRFYVCVLRSRYLYVAHRTHVCRLRTFVCRLHLNQFAFAVVLLILLLRLPHYTVDFGYVLPRFTFAVGFTDFLLRCTRFAIWFTGFTRVRLRWFTAHLRLPRLRYVYVCFGFVCAYVYAFTRFTVCVSYYVLPVTGYVPHPRVTFTLHVCVGRLVYVPVYTVAFRLIVTFVTGFVYALHTVAVPFARVLVIRVLPVCCRGYVTHVSSLRVRLRLPHSTTLRLPHY